jgi:hypothetical protein
MTRFRLVQVLSWSNSPTSSIIVLCYKIGCPRLLAGCYLYSPENCLINMVGFQLYYNLNKHVPDWDST